MGVFDGEGGVYETNRYYWEEMYPGNGAEKGARRSHEPEVGNNGYRLISESSEKEASCRRNMGERKDIRQSSFLKQEAHSADMRDGCATGLMEGWIATGGERTTIGPLGGAVFFERNDSAGL